MKVLVEQTDFDRDLWYPLYSGIVLAETPERYLVKHHLIFRSWCPKNGGLMRCREIKKTSNKI